MYVYKIAAKCCIHAAVSVTMVFHVCATFAFVSTGTHGTHGTSGNPSACFWLLQTGCMI